jgi:reductive dehalogenase
MASFIDKHLNNFKVPKRVSEPTYQQDVIGDIELWDERDIVFARTDLFEYFGEDSQAFHEYYAQHPELLDYDKKVNKRNDMGKTGGVDKSMFEAQFEIADKISPESFVDGEPADNQVKILPERASEKVIAFARFLGADLVGIGPLNQEWVYSHSARSHGDSEGYIPRGTGNDLTHHTNAIAIAVRQDYDLIRSAPDFPVLLATAKGYALSAWVSIQLAEYIRMLGYSARASHFHNYRVLTIPVAVDCGLGELSRAGFLLTKEYGLAIRLAVVTTNFPLKHDEPIDIGVQSFCETCKICAEECPIGAIPSGEKVAYNGVLKWKLDEQKCYRYWQAVGTDCAVCMTSCPWTKPNNSFHRSIAWLATFKGPHQRLLTKADQLLYGRHRSAPRPEFLDPNPRLD